MGLAKICKKHNIPRPTLGYWAKLEHGSQAHSVRFFNNLAYWRELTGVKEAPSALIYGGEEAFRRSGVFIYPWHVL